MSLLSLIDRFLFERASVLLYSSLPTFLRGASLHAAAPVRVFFAALCCALLLAAGTPEPARAQLRMEDLTFRASGGAMIPVVPSELEEGYDVGLAMAGGIGLAVSPALSVSLAGSYGRLGASSGGREDGSFDPDLALGAEASGGDISVLSGGLDLRYHLSTDSDFGPYLVGGLSAYRFQREDAFARAAAFRDLPIAYPPGRVCIQGREETAFGASFGIGIQFPVSYTAAFFVEPRYTITFTDPEALHMLPIRAGFVFGEF